MPYNHTGRPGVGAVGSVNPQTLLPDLDEMVRSLSPEATPFLTMSAKLRKGRNRKPERKKVEVLKRYEYDHFEEMTSYTLGTGNYTRFAKIKLSNKTRPRTGNSMYYYPQDRFRLPNGQVGMVVMTPDACYQVNGSDATIADTGFTGNSTSRCAAGYIIVRNTQQAPLLPAYPGDYIIAMPRTIRESQPVGGLSKLEDVLFDANYVQHMEQRIEFTNDQRDFIKQVGKLDFFNDNQKYTFENFKKGIEYAIWFERRSINYDEDNLPMLSMGGIIENIETNIQLYNPDSTEDFERMVVEFMNKKAFRHNPNGNVKTAHCGVDFITNFSMAFREYRRSELEKKEITPGLTIQGYEINGYTLKLVRNEVFRMDTPMSHWCVVLDPIESELRIAKDFESWEYNGQAVGKRTYERVWEFQGTIAHHREESSAILRTGAAA